MSLPAHITSDPSGQGFLVCLHCGARRPESVFGTGVDIAMKKFAILHRGCTPPQEAKPPKRQATVLRWQCGLCSFLNESHGVSPDKVDTLTPVGDWTGDYCRECGEFQYLRRVGENISDQASWEFICTMPPDDQPLPYDLLDGEVISGKGGVTQ